MSLASGIWLQGVLKVLKSCIASMYGVFTYISHIYMYIYIDHTWMLRLMHASPSSLISMTMPPFHLKKHFAFGTG